MIKKSMLVTAAALAALVALSPLAFAADDPTPPKDDGFGLVNLDDQNALDGLKTDGLPKSSILGN